MNYLVNSTDLTNIANSIRAKKGTVNTMEVSEMASEIASIPTSGGTDNLELLLKGTLTSYTVPNSVTSIPDCAFYHNETLESITFPATLTSIGAEAFSESALEGNIVLPSGLRNIGNYAFESCYGLTGVTFPNMTDWNTFTGYASFSGCSNLTTLVNFNFPDVMYQQSIPQYMFSGTALVGEITCPSFVRFNDYCFNNSNSSGMFYIHLTDENPLNYFFGAGAFNTSHCRLVVPYSSDHSVLSDYQREVSGWSSIIIEETP